jgi:hypothetical protein
MATINGSEVMGELTFDGNIIRGEIGMWGEFVPNQHGKNEYIGKVLNLYGEQVLSVQVHVKQFVNNVSFLEVVVETT